MREDIKICGQRAGIWNHPLSDLHQRKVGLRKQCMSFFTILSSKEPKKIYTVVDRKVAE